MDTRRRLIAPLGALAPVALALLPAACAPPPPHPTLVGTEPLSRVALAPPAQPVVLTLAGAPRLPKPCRASRSRNGHAHHARACFIFSAARRAVAQTAAAGPPRAPSAHLTGPAASRALAIAALVTAPDVSAPPGAQPPSDRMDGAIKVFAFTPGRVFTVAAAPLRVTTLALEPGETLIAKAAGDTVRWEIGETTSGSGGDVRTLVLLKPLTPGLSTNMVLTTSRRVYLLDLSSVGRKADTAITWSYAAVVTATPPRAQRGSAHPDPVTLGSVSARYRIEPVGRRPAWTPQAVFDDGRRTFIAFGPDLVSRSAPLLFASNTGGEPQIVNYRKAGDLYIVDGLFPHLELRLGDRPAQVVRLSRFASEAGA